MLGHALLLGDQFVEEEQQRRRGVDRHRRRHLVERNPVQQHLHVGDRVDRDAGPPHLALGHRVVRVEPELRRQVEGDREARLAAREQIAVALVRLLRRREAGVLANRPRTAAVHVRVRPAGERERPRRRRLDGRRIGRAIERLHLEAGVEEAFVERLLGHPSILCRSRRAVTVATRGRRRSGRSRRARCPSPTRCAF